MTPAPLSANSPLRRVARAIEHASLATGALSALVLIGVAGYFYAGELVNDLARETAVLRAVTEKFIAERPDSWEFGSDRLNARLESYVSRRTSYRIETPDGLVVAARETSPGGQRISRKEEVLAFGRHVGNIETGIPLFGPLLVGSAVLLFALGVATLLVKLLRLRPLAVLRETEFSMQHTQDRLRQLNTRLESIREEERTRIAREIHDEIGQQITAIKIATVGLLQAAEHTEDRTRLVSMFDHAMKTVRNIAWELRPSILDTLGLAAAIQALGEDFQRRTATRCRVSIPAAPLAVDARLATQLFRICQELLTNVTRHALASRVDITLAAGPPIMLEVADNGIGIAPGALDGMSLGLLGIEERVLRMGATLGIETNPQFSGTRIRVVLQPDQEKPAGGGAP